MVTSPECTGLFLPLLQTMQDSTSPADNRVDAYLSLTERLREEEDAFLTDVCQHINNLAAVFKRDITSHQIELSQAALQTLGHCFYQEQISRSFIDQDVKDILTVLADVISKTSDKGVCTRAMWCIAKQNLPASSIHSQLLKILTSIQLAIKNKLQSPAIDNEALCVIERFLQQFPENVMKDFASHWCCIAFPLIVSAAGKVREHGLSLISSNLDLIISGGEGVVQWLLPALKTDLIAYLAKLCRDKKELFVLKVWECIVPVLGKALHRSSIINDILKLVEQGFKNSSVAVQVESYNAWKVLINNFALSQDVLSSEKRVKLIMMPLLNSALREKHEDVELARLSAWWHYICSFEHSRLLELFDKVCVPLLHFIFGTGIHHVSLLKAREGYGDLKCPLTPNTDKTFFKFETPKATARRSLRDVGTPKTPTVIDASFAKTAKDRLLRQGCEILLNMLSLESAFPNTNFTFDEAIEETVFQTSSDFEKHAKVLINAVREAIKACGKEISDNLLTHLWGSLVDQVERQVIEDMGEMFELSFLSLVAAAEEILEGKCVSTVTCLKFLEKLSNVSPGLLNHYNASLHSKDNSKGSIALLMIQHLLSSQLLQSGLNLERFHTVFQNFFMSGINAPAGQLFHVQAVLQIMENSACFISGKTGLWRVWSHVASSLNEYIIKNNEVNQGNALEHNFTAVYLALLLPGKEILNKSLDQEQIRITNVCMENLYRTFTRAVDLVPSIEINCCSEELCGKLLMCWDDTKAKDFYYLSGIGHLVSVILECLDYNTANPVFISKSPIKSPSGLTKKMQQPLGNFKSVLHVTRKVLVAGHDVIITKKTDDCAGIFAVVLANIVDKLSLFYQQLIGPSVIASVTDALAHSLVPVFRLSHQSTKETKSSIEKVVFTKKIIKKVDRLWLDIITSVQSRHGEPYSNELLLALSPLLKVTLNHHRRQLKNQAIQFWNSTFGTALTLKYPDSLRPVLKSVKDKSCLMLPGWNEVNSKQTSTTLVEEPSQLTQVTQGSPVRIKLTRFFGGSPNIKGSFLHKTAEAKKVVEKCSPNKPWTELRLSPKGKSPIRNRHARRKLPLSVFEDDSQDYVAIVPSPAKKRLLTEHQKEIIGEKSIVPVLYNFLDQSQDATLLIQETITTPPVNDRPAPLLKYSKSEQKQKNKQLTADPISSYANEKSSLSEDQSKVFIEETQYTETENQMSIQETPTKYQLPKSSNQEEMTSSGVIPFSQQSSGTLSQSCKSLRSSSNFAINNMVVLINGVTEKEQHCKSVTPSFLPIKEGNEQAEVENLVEDKTDGVLPTDASTNKEDYKKSKNVQPNKVKSYCTKKNHSFRVGNTSPVSGRTRRGCQLKVDTPKIQTSKGKVEQIPETENCSETQDFTNRKDSPEKMVDQDIQSQQDKPETVLESTDPERKAKHTAHDILPFMIDGTCSPISSTKIRFMKPSAQSPTQISLKAFHSPLASPTTSILKRSTGRYDSPSPPNKVRRVSFAQPLAQEAENDQCKQVALPVNASVPSKTNAESATMATMPSKESNSLPFTLVKRRRKTPIKAEKDDESSTSIYPDLVDCSLPVDQILPSLTSLTWSRGLGHVVYAQNIRTIGNLSALKEHQIKNLPIKSPKVQTLRRALESFHQKSSRGHRGTMDLLTDQEKNYHPRVTINDNIASTMSACNEFIVNDKSKKPLPIKHSESKIHEGKKCNLVNEQNSKEKSAEQTWEKMKTHKETETSKDNGKDEEVTFDGKANSDAAFLPALPQSTDKVRAETEPKTGSTTPSVSSPTQLVAFSREDSLVPEDFFVNNLISKLDEEVEENAVEPQRNVDVVTICDKIADKKDGIDDSQRDGPVNYQLHNANQVKHGTEECEPPEKKICKSLKSIVHIATPEVLSNLSCEDIFDAHTNLTHLMSKVINALQAKMALHFEC